MLMYGEAYYMSKPLQPSSVYAYCQKCYEQIAHIEVNLALAKQHDKLVQLKRNCSALERENEVLRQKNELLQKRLDLEITRITDSRKHSRQISSREFENQGSLRTNPITTAPQSKDMMAFDSDFSKILASLEDTMRSINSYLAETEFQPFDLQFITDTKTRIFAEAKKKMEQEAIEMIEDTILKLIVVRRDGPEGTSQNSFDQSQRTQSNRCESFYDKLMNVVFQVCTFQYDLEKERETEIVDMAVSKLGCPWQDQIHQFNIQLIGLKGELVGDRRD